VTAESILGPRELITELTIFFCSDEELDPEDELTPEEELDPDPELDSVDETDPEDVMMFSSRPTTLVEEPVMDEEEDVADADEIADCTTESIRGWIAVRICEIRSDCDWTDVD